MVRVGGGWDTLENYLDKHDPCRCSSSIDSVSSKFTFFFYFYFVSNNFRYNKIFQFFFVHQQKKIQLCFVLFINNNEISGLVLANFFQFVQKFILEVVKKIFKILQVLFVSSYFSLSLSLSLSLTLTLSFVLSFFGLYIRLG